MTLRGHIKSFNGEVVFYKDTECNYISCDTTDEDGKYDLRDDQVEIGRAKVSVVFSSSTEAEIESLEKIKRRILIDAQAKTKRIEEKIQNLRAITHQE